MINPEQQLDMMRPDTTSEEASEKLVDLELANQIKDKIDTIAQGRSLDSLTQDELNNVLGGYKDIEKTLGIVEKKIKNPVFVASFEGKEIPFNTEQTLKEHKELYNSLNLTQWSEELPESINLTQEQIDQIKEKVEKYGFNKMRILPSIETQNKTLQEEKDETQKPIEELKDSEQYSDDGTYLSDTVKPEFPDKIKTINRPKGKCYIQLYKDEKEVSAEILVKSANEARKWLKDNDLQGYTLAEYLIFQREFIIKNKNHPDNNKWTWLTDSELSSSQALDSLRLLFGRQVGVISGSSGLRGDYLGFRSSAVLEI